MRIDFKRTPTKLRAEAEQKEHEEEEAAQDGLRPDAAHHLGHRGRVGDEGEACRRADDVVDFAVQRGGHESQGAEGRDAA